jgi:hypothetical protein
MKESNQKVSSAEMRKNLFTGAIAGGMLGVVLGYSFGSMLLGIPVGILFGLAIAYRLSRFPAKMRYPMNIIRRMFLAGSLAMLAVFVFVYLQERGLSPTEIILASLIPIAAWAFLVVTLGMAIASLDELQRRIQTEAIAIGFAGTAIICGAYGLMSLAGILPALNLGLVVFGMILMWFIGKLWTMWRYR